MTSGTRVSLLSSTDGRPFDDTIVSESCERSAVELSRGLEIETTFHIRQCRESGVSEVARKVNGPIDSLEVLESIDVDELRIIGDLESTSNLRQLGKGDIL